MPLHVYIEKSLSILKHVTKCVFTGALGSAPLSFILPCVFHMKLLKNEMPWYIKVKDILIIVLSVSILAAGGVVVVQQIVLML